MRPSRGGVGSRIGLKVVLGVILVWTVVPLAWMVLSSFKPSADLTASSPKLSFSPTFEHYNALFSGGNNIGPYIRNSLLAAGISTIIAVTLGCLAGYGLARSRFRGKDHIAFWIISQRMAPIAAVVLPSLLWLYIAIQVLAAVGGILAGLEHRSLGQAALRGFGGGLCYGAGIILVHDIVGGTDHNLLQQPILFPLITAVFGAIFAAIGCFVRRRLEGTSS